MSDIILITPPDKVYNKNKNILLINPSEEHRQSIQNILANNNEPVNIYLYSDNIDLDWLLTMHRICDAVFLDLDNMPQELRDLASYLVSFNNTYWLTKGENIVYNKISNKRIYDFEFLNNILGGEIEKKQQ